MNQTINQLERERKEKIRNLNPEETEAYIDSLNDKIYTALADKDYDKQNYYNDKLLEAITILKERYSNMNLVVSQSKISFLNADLLCERLSSKIMNYRAVTQGIIDNSYTLHQLKYHLDSILHIYYFNYHNRIGVSVTDKIDMELWEKLDEDTFNNLDIGFHYENDSYHNMLLESFDRLIGEIRDDCLQIIDNDDRYVSLGEYLPDLIESAKENFESEKEYIFKNIKDRPIKIIKEKGYLDLLLEEIEAMSFCFEAINEYNSMKKNVLDVIDGDAFELFKELDYNFRKEDCDKYDFISCPSKEDYFKSKPSYNVRNLELKRPSDSHLKFYEGDDE